MKITGFELLHGHTLSVDTEITKKDVVKMVTVVAVTTLLNPAHAYAASTDIVDRIWTAAAPIKGILIGAADPVCEIVFTWGLLECMLGKGASGLTRMKYAALGYMALNWMPVFMEIMRSAKP